jgi:hypothetical protein
MERVKSEQNLHFFHVKSDGICSSQLCLSCKQQDIQAVALNKERQVKATESGSL